MKRIPVSENPRILIIRLSAIGDVIHALPCLYAIKEAFPSAYIGWVVQGFAAPLIKNIKIIDKLHCLTRGQEKTFKPETGGQTEKWKTWKQIRSEGYEISLDLQGLTKSAVWGLLAGTRFRIGYGDRDGREFSKFFYNKRIVPPRNAEHVVDRNLSLLQTLGITQPQVRFDLPADEEASRWSKKMLEDSRLSPPVVVVHPGAGWPTKRWPPERYAQVCSRLHDDFGFSVVISTGPQEDANRDRMSDGLRSVPHAAPAMDQLQLQETLREADLFIGPDTGPMHLAVAVGTYTVAIFGASDPVRNGPYGEKHLSISKDFQCQPCWKKVCERIRCLDELTVSNVYASIHEYWSHKSAKRL